MKTNLIILVFDLLFMSFLMGCDRTYAEMPTSLPTIIAVTKTQNLTKTSTITTSPTSTLTSTELTSLPLTITSSPTLIPLQIPGPLFPPGYSKTANDPGVAANHYDDAGGYHFDVGIPLNLIPGEGDVLAPVSGTIFRYVKIDDGTGDYIVIRPDPPLAGLDELVAELGHNPSEIFDVNIELAHIYPYITSGKIEAGQPIATPANRMDDFKGWDEWANIVAFNIIIFFPDKTIKICACDIPNNGNYCGHCYPGAAERNPCP
jgi:hypothetical protein